MSIRFASSSRGDVGAVARVLRGASARFAANDNGSRLGGDGLLPEALRHFAEHGLSAARRARNNAEAAFAAGDHDGYHAWRAICRILDRRMASAIRAGKGKRR